MCGAQRSGRPPGPRQDACGGMLNRLKAAGVTFIKNTPEFKHACNAERFDFVSPILILEGLKFYEDYLLKNMNR